MIELANFITYILVISVTMLGSWFALRFRSVEHTKAIEKINTFLREIKTELIQLELKSTHFLSYKEATKNHPTKEEIESLKKTIDDINKKLESMCDKFINFK